MLTIRQGRSGRASGPLISSSQPAVTIAHRRVEVHNTYFDYFSYFLSLFGYAASGILCAARPGLPSIAGFRYSRDGGVTSGQVHLF